MTKPFLKWVGGKTSILDEVLKRFPEKENIRPSYVEPFLGGGSVLFGMDATKFCGVFVSDINKKLINTYARLTDNVEGVISQLLIFKTNHNKDFYYKARKEFNSEFNNGIIDAARFIYLNKTCFNGIYRENSKGEFNVPIGSYKNPGILDEEGLRKCSDHLKRLFSYPIDGLVNLRYCSFNQPPINNNTFYYLDPPYHECYTQYNKSNFNEDFQKKVKTYCDDINKVESKFLLSNSNTDYIKHLYKGYRIETIQSNRCVSADKTKRGKFDELLIRNF